VALSAMRRRALAKGVVMLSAIRELAGWTYVPDRRHLTQNNLTGAIHSAVNDIPTIKVI